MRRLFIMIMTLMLVIGVAACSQAGTEPTGHAGSDDTGSGTPADGNITLTARIMEIKGTSFLAANMAEDANDADIYWIHAGDMEVIGVSGGKLKSDALKEGMLVDILYDGVVMDSYPMQIGNMKSIRVREEGDDLAGFYMSVIDDLYKTDPGLNGGIERIAFDFSGVSNLTETEKTALVYRLGSFYAIEAIRGTHDELVEQGYIDNENLSFETGILFIIELSNVESDRFNFNIRKWRSGDGAYYFQNCTAKKTNGSWKYTVGSHMIS